MRHATSDGDMSFEMMTNTLDTFLRYVVISKQEKAQLKPNMPASWYQQESKPLMARFELAGIVI